MFAIYTRGVPIAGNMPASRSREKGSRVWDGVLDGVRNWKMVLQGGSIGAIAGVVPGVGGTLGMFGAYALAKKTSKDPASFGKGNPIGVLAPESANNAKEGGSFVPTLAFGVPGSSGMALVIVILLIMGFVPGPDLVNNHLDIVFLIAWVMALSNILCSVMGIGLAPVLSKLAFLRPQLLAPALIAISLIGSFIDTRLAMSIVIALVFGFIGYVFKATGYSSAGLILGFILGPVVDQNLGLSLQVFGPDFLLRPIPIILGALVVLALLWPPLKRLLLRRRRAVPTGAGPDPASSGEQQPEETRTVSR
jgi:TctA family transporter